MGPGTKKVDLNELACFAEICEKICLNIPDSYSWEWDARRNMALMTLSLQDAELVFFPLFHEFKEHWNFSSPIQPEALIAKLLNAEYGLMPGQFFFTSRPIDDLVLFVAWWPWGGSDKVSMRVGLYSLVTNKPDPDLALTCLARWLRIGDNEPGAGCLEQIKSQNSNSK